MSFNYLNLFKPNEHTEDYHLRKPNDENFLFEIENKNYICIGDKVVSSDTNYEILSYSSKLGFNDNNFSFAYSDKNVHLMLHQKYNTIQDYESLTENDENRYLYKEDDELKGDQTESLLNMVMNL